MRNEVLAGPALEITTEVIANRPVGWRPWLSAQRYTCTARKSVSCGASAGRSDCRGADPEFDRAHLPMSL